MVVGFLMASTLLMLMLPFLFPILIISAGRVVKGHIYDTPEAPNTDAGTRPMVSVIIPIHRKSGVIKQKLHDIAASDYPINRMEIILMLDGLVKGIEEALAEFKKEATEAPRLTVISCKRSGKNTVLNSAVEHSSGSILVFTDADARLDPSAISLLIRPFSNIDVGGACGLHLLSSKKGAQRTYWNIESLIKTAEQKLLGRLTASYGTMSAIRKDLFTPIPLHVADDLYLLLSVVSQGRRFSFCPQARVYIEKPSQTLLDEIKRRRRIVSQSLGTLKHFNALMNPFKHGLYAVCLMCHKLLRRLVPLNAILLFLLCLWQALWGSEIFVVLTFIQAGVYGLFGTLLFRAVKEKNTPTFLKVPVYFFATNMGMLMGTIDFVRNKTQTIWE